MKPLLLHFTDLHLYADAGWQLKGVNTRNSFAAVAKTACKAFPDCKAVILGGDLAQDESEGGYRAVARIMLDCTVPVYAIAGNHDDQAVMERILKPTIRFARSISELKLGRWRVLLLNTQQAGEVGGAISWENMERLRERIEQEPDAHFLLVMHHQPQPVGSRWLDRIGLQNGSQLMAMASRLPQVRGMLFGHAHQEFDDSYDGIRLLGTPSTCIQFRPNSTDVALDDRSPGYRWLRLQDDGTIETGVERIEGFVPPDLSDISPY